ncbi:DUF5133 domain-containing protein [Streptomyces monashensis]|uniref:DUF5133 domain-containing protein n=1 Tax=Streptomyces monashensis TaxID=1678012 RepID=UPI0033E26615
MMPLIDYAVLRRLIDEFDVLTQSSHRSPDDVRRLQDVQYTMCVYTGVRNPREAVATARALLTSAEAPKV